MSLRDPNHRRRAERPDASLSAHAGRRKTTGRPSAGHLRSGGSQLMPTHRGKPSRCLLKPTRRGRCKATALAIVVLKRGTKPTVCSPRPASASTDAVQSPWQAATVTRRARRPGMRSYRARGECRGIRRASTPSLRRWRWMGRSCCRISSTASQHVAPANHMPITRPAAARSALHRRQRAHRKGGCECARALQAHR